MTVDQIHPESTTGRGKKERCLCFGNTVHLIFMPIKNKLSSTDGGESREKERRGRDRGVKERMSERSQREQDTIPQPGSEQRGRVLCQNNVTPRAKTECTTYLKKI